MKLLTIAIAIVFGVQSSRAQSINPVVYSFVTSPGASGFATGRLVLPGSTKGEGKSREQAAWEQLKALMDQHSGAVYLEFIGHHSEGVFWGDGRESCRLNIKRFLSLIKRKKYLDRITHLHFQGCNTMVFKTIGLLSQRLPRLQSILTYVNVIGPADSPGIKTLARAITAISGSNTDKKNDLNAKQVFTNYRNRYPNLLRRTALFVRSKKGLKSYSLSYDGVNVETSTIAQTCAELAPSIDEIRDLSDYIVLGIGHEKRQAQVEAFKKIVSNIPALRRKYFESPAYQKLSTQGIAIASVLRSGPPAIITPGPFKDFFRDMETVLNIARGCFEHELGEIVSAQDMVTARYRKEIIQNLNKCYPSLKKRLPRAMRPLMDPNLLQRESIADIRSMLESLHYYGNASDLTSEKDEMEQLRWGELGSMGRSIVAVIRNPKEFAKESPVLQAAIKREYEKIKKRKKDYGSSRFTPSVESIFVGMFYVSNRIFWMIPEVTIVQGETTQIQKGDFNRPRMERIMAGLSVALSRVLRTEYVKKNPLPDYLGNRFEDYLGNNLVMIQTRDWLAPISNTADCGALNKALFSLARKRASGLKEIRTPKHSKDQKSKGKRN